MLRAMQCRRGYGPRGGYGRTTFVCRGLCYDAKMKWAKTFEVGEREVLEKEKRSQMDILHKQKEIEKWGAEKVKQMAHGD